LDQDGHSTRAAADRASAATAGAATNVRRRATLAALLTALSGFVDAVGYIQLNHLFVSFMSGNSTHLGMTLAKSDWHDALAAAAIIAAFTAGTSAGTLIADAFSRSVVLLVLGAELILALAAIGLIQAGHGRSALGLVAIAMGMQNTLHQIVAGADIGKGFITGTLMSLGQSLARLSRDRKEGAGAAQNALSWIAFVAGAVLGALLFSTVGLTASFAAAATAVVCLIVLVGAGRL
jgi:uncharacterized membrane protein YoaK (UPF0700 family)